MFDSTPPNRSAGPAPTLLRITLATSAWLLALVVLGVLGFYTSGVLSLALLFAGASRGLGVTLLWIWVGMLVALVLVSLAYLVAFIANLRQWRRARKWIGWTLVCFLATVYGGAWLVILVVEQTVSGV